MCALVTVVQTFALPIFEAAHGAGDAPRQEARRDDGEEDERRGADGAALEGVARVVRLLDPGEAEVLACGGDGGVQPGRPGGAVDEHLAEGRRIGRESSEERRAGKEGGSSYSSRGAPSQ